MGSVAPFDSHSCAPSLFDRTAGGGTGCCSLSEPVGPAACDRRSEVSAKLKPVDPAQFLFGTKPMRPSVLSPSRQGWNRRSVPAMHSTPQLSPRLRARYRRPQSLQNQGKKAPHPLPRPADGVVILAPFGSDRRDPNTLAPNRKKARPNPLRPSRTSTSS